MPVLIPILSALFFNIIVPLAVKLLLAFGVGFATYYGVDQLLSSSTFNMSSYFSGLPANVLGVFGLAGFDRFFNLLMSAFAAKAVVSGLSSVGVLKKMVFK